MYIIHVINNQKFGKFMTLIIEDEIQETAIKGPAKNSEIPIGYKITELGILPKEWQVKPLQNCLLGTPEYGINAPAVPYQNILPKYIRITDITEDGQFSTEKLSSVNANVNEIEKYLLTDGDLVFARTGASVGKSYHYNSKDGLLVFAGFLIRIKPDQKFLLSNFLALYLKTHFYKKWVQLVSMRSGQPGINGNEYGQLPVSLPPLQEQQAIAATLSDIDSLINSLDQLIAKKRNIKLAAMHQLLTGKQRLPGFSGEWRLKKLDDLLNRIANGAVYRPTNSSGIPITRIETISNGYIDFQRIGYAENSSEIEKYKIELGDILFSHINSLDHIGKVAFFDSNDLLYHGMNLLLLRANNEVNSRFLYYWLASEIGRKNSRTLAKQAVSQASINTSELKTIEINVPDLSEQLAIASFITDMDTELSALKQQLSKARNLKQGMMQELLTGRIRLKNEERWTQ